MEIYSIKILYEKYKFRKISNVRQSYKLKLSNVIEKVFKNKSNFSDNGMYTVSRVIN